MRITVIGSGNSGLIHAAKMYEKGQQVAILKTTSKGNLDFFKKIKQAGEYEVVF